MKKSDRRYGVYAAWAAMRTRCNNPRDSRYRDYGGRGIRVCKRWDVFENFFADMGMRPKGRSLDRIFNNKGYYKSNCRWATVAEQQANRRGNIVTVIDGRKTTLAAASQKAGLRHGLVLGRYLAGWRGRRLLAPPRRYRPTSSPAD